MSFWRSWIRHCMHIMPASGKARKSKAFSITGFWRSAIITLLLVGGIYNFIVQGISSTDVLQKLGVTLLQFTEIVKVIAIVYASLGIGVGVIGSSISMKKYLEV